jgi:hypothetical protein
MELCDQRRDRVPLLGRERPDGASVALTALVALRGKVRRRQRLAAGLRLHLRGLEHREVLRAVVHDGSCGRLGVQEHDLRRGGLLREGSPDDQYGEGDGTAPSKRTRHGASRRTTARA